MGKYSVRLFDGKIQHVDISRQISNAFKFTKTYEPDHIGRVDVDEHIYSMIVENTDWSGTKLWTVEGIKNPTFHMGEIENNNKLSKNLKAFNYRTDLKMCKFMFDEGPATNLARTFVTKFNLRTCILNFADPWIDPIGFTNGKDSQEDSLMRQTSLYVTLKKNKIYKENQDLNDGYYNDSMIYSSRVPVFRSPLKERLLLINEVFEVSFITAFYPDLNIPKTEKVGNKVYINPIDVDTTLKNRLKIMV